IGLYPEYAEVVLTDLLKETPSGDPGVIFERARLELKRIAHLEYISPLGFDRRTVLAIRASGQEALKSATQAAQSDVRWNIGLTQEMHNRATGFPALAQYPFNMGSPPRPMKATALFPAMEEGTVNLVMTSSSDGHLTLSKWKALDDDRMVFPAAPVALLVRDS